jgi:serine/threonine-protein kinase
LLSAIARACAKEAAERHASAAELCADFEACLGASPLLPEVETPGRVAPPRSISRPNVAPTPQDTVALATETLAAAPDARGPALARVLAFARRHHRLLLSSSAAAVLLAVAAVAVGRWLDERPMAQARELLDAGHPEAARELVAAAALRHPDDARLRALQGRVLHRIEGQVAAGVEAYAAALDLDPGALDAVALSDLAADLSRDRRVADRSAELLVRAGQAATPAVLAATRSGTGAARLRALELARELGAEGRVDLVEAYGALLEDADCEVRRAAARRLGEIGSVAAVPRLSEVARETRTMKPLFGQAHEVPACAAEEARMAIRKIEER